jgi:tetratricopeptide (TPR) repeat protein
MLDAEESFHLALHASSVGQHHACTEYRKEILAQQPDNAPAIYLLAAQHAELGLHERAIRGMRAALAIEPGLEMARFQLGLLLLDLHRRPEASETFAALSGSPDDELRIFSAAMVAFCGDDPKVTIEKLARAVERPSRNAPLSALMRRMLRALLKDANGAATASPAQDSRISLGAYGQLPS